MNTPTKFMFSYQFTPCRFEKSVDRSNGQEAIVRIIEYFYNAQSKFTFENGRPDPDLDVPD